MNYKTYLTLTKEQKEEYDYRFKDKKFNISIGVIFANTFLFMFMSMMIMFIAVLAIDNEKYIDLQESAKIMIDLVPIIFYMIIPLICLIVLVDVITFIVNKYLYYKYIKKQKIKIIRWWHKE